jgi:ATP-dependent DNA helicase RecQ
LINLCEIAFHQQNKIRLTSLAREVLFEGDKVQLTVQKLTRRNRTERDQKQICSHPFETLRRLRYAISKDENVPAYVFSDAALRQMETIRPMSDDEFTTIDGVGKAKLENMEMPL